MASTRATWFKRLLIVPPIAAGVAALLLFLGDQPAPKQAPPAEIARPVRVISVVPADFVPRAIGYGYVQPGSTWNAVAQVAGKVVERHSDLEAGELFDAGTVLLRIDPVDYELAVAQIEARIASVRAELAELEVREDNTRTSLDIERRAVALAEAELQRKKVLLSRGNASQATVDESERQVLSQRQRVQDLANQLNLIPAQRQVLEASLTLSEAQLDDARLDLERTTIRLPFDARIAEVEVEENQFVNVGTTLVVADSIDVAEVAAQVPIEQMARVVPRDVVVSDLSAAEIGLLPGRMGLGAVVRLKTGAVIAQWKARVARISPAIDPQTRTVGVVVAVDQPYRQAIPGIRPPLIKNMYVQVELFGRPWPDSIVVPRVALHRTRAGPHVYVAGADDRLAIRAVTVGPEQGDLVVVDSGLEPGERIVVTDLIPAVDGMLLVPNEDAALARQLVADAGRSQPADGATSPAVP